MVLVGWGMCGKQRGASLPPLLSFHSLLARLHCAQPTLGIPQAGSFVRHKHDQKQQACTTARKGACGGLHHENQNNRTFYPACCMHRPQRPGRRKPREHPAAAHDAPCLPPPPPPQHTTRVEKKCRGAMMRAMFVLPANTTAKTTVLPLSFGPLPPSMMKDMQSVSPCARGSGGAEVPPPTR